MEAFLLWAVCLTVLCCLLAPLLQVPQVVVALPATIQVGKY